MNHGRRQFEWPWKDILYFAATLVIVTLALVVAATLFVENSSLQNRVEALEDFVDTIPGLLEELRDKVDALGDDLTDRIENIEESFQPLIEKGAVDGYAPLDNEAIVPDEHLPPNLLNAMFLGNDGGGCWDASTNTPLLICGQECNVGEFYIINNTGTSMLDSFGGLNDPWQVGDAVVCTGDIGWKRVRDIPRVKTWNGITGDVEAFLDTLLDVDQTGASIGDALVFTAGDIWKPTDCCVAGPEGTSVGFLAMLDNSDTAGGPDPNDDDNFPSDILRAQWCFSQVWQSVDFMTTGKFPTGTTQPVIGGAVWDPTNPNFVHIPHDFSTAPAGLFFGSGTYTVPETGWWEVKSKIRPNLFAFYGMRLFRLNTGLEAIYQEDSLLPELLQSNDDDDLVRGPSDPVLTIEGTFAFCKGEVLQIQFYLNVADDDTGDTPCLVENPSGPFDQGSIKSRGVFETRSHDDDDGVGRYPPNGGMYWSMWKMPNVLMPAIQACSGFSLKKRDHNDEPIVYPTTWADPALTYKLNMKRWRRNTAFYNSQCGGGPINCTHYKPGPEPEMPSILKPPPPAAPPDSELKK